jgi:hypothetical protein
MLVPGVAGISIPLWYEDANAVGEDLFPKYELILVIPGNGQKNSLVELMSAWLNLIVLNCAVFPKVFE